MRLLIGPDTSRISCLADRFPMRRVRPFLPAGAVFSLIQIPVVRMPEFEKFVVFWEPWYSTPMLCPISQNRDE
jgi:hypothetical protein